MPATIQAGSVRSKYAFIKAHRKEFPTEVVCRVLEMAPSGYYQSLQRPQSNRAIEDARFLRLNRASFTASQGVYGAPRVFLDLRKAGETCSKHRVARLMRENGLRALHGYRTRRWIIGKSAGLIPNLLKRQFTVTRQDTAWATDITYIRTWKGWLYLAVVLNLFSRKVVGWAARPTIHRELVDPLNTLAPITSDTSLEESRRVRDTAFAVHAASVVAYCRPFLYAATAHYSMHRREDCLALEFIEVDEYLVLVDVVESAGIDCGGDPRNPRTLNHFVVDRVSGSLGIVDEEKHDWLFRK